MIPIAVGILGPFLGHVLGAGPFISWPVFMLLGVINTCAAQAVTGANQWRRIAAQFWIWKSIFLAITCVLAPNIFVSGEGLLSLQYFEYVWITVIVAGALSISVTAVGLEFWPDIMLKLEPGNKHENILFKANEKNP